MTCDVKSDIIFTFTYAIGRLCIVTINTQNNHFFDIENADLRPVNAVAIHSDQSQ